MWRGVAGRALRFAVSAAGRRTIRQGGASAALQSCTDSSRSAALRSKSKAADRTPTLVWRRTCVALYHVTMQAVSVELRSRRRRRYCGDSHAIVRGRPAPAAAKSHSQAALRLSWTTSALRAAKLCAMEVVEGGATFIQEGRAWDMRNSSELEPAAGKLTGPRGDGPRRDPCRPCRATKANKAPVSSTRAAPVQHKQACGEARRAA